jgi:hypothetical protein
MRRLGLLLLLALAALVPPVAARQGDEGDNRAALVVVYGDGQMDTRCVAFAEPEISGYDALSRAGLAVESDAQAGGAAVCRVDGVGCAAGDCFCACRGGECRYWSYWQWRDSAWQYAAAGASQSRVSDGAVEGWVWGLGTVTKAQPPPVVSFEEVCAAGAVNSDDPADTSAASSPDWATYGLFAAVVLLLAGLPWLARRRMGGKGV